jgi:hypothetical protein
MTPDPVGPPMIVPLFERDIPQNWLLASSENWKKRLEMARRSPSR